MFVVAVRPSTLIIQLYIVLICRGCQNISPRLQEAIQEAFWLPTPSAYQHFGSRYPNLSGAKSLSNSKVVDDDFTLSRQSSLSPLRSLRDSELGRNQKMGCKSLF